MVEALPVQLPNPQTQGRQLRAVRRRKGLSLSDVARGAGLSRRELVNYEKGKVAIPSSDLWVLAGSCGVDVSELVPPAPSTGGGELVVASRMTTASVEDAIDMLRRSVLPPAAPAPPAAPVLTGRAAAAIGAATTDAAPPVSTGDTPDWLASLGTNGTRPATGGTEPAPGASMWDVDPASAPTAPDATATWGHISDGALPATDGPVDVFRELSRLPEPEPLIADGTATLDDAADGPADGAVELVDGPPIGAVELVDPNPVEAWTDDLIVAPADAAPLEVTGREPSGSFWDRLAPERPPADEETTANVPAGDASSLPTAASPWDELAGTPTIDATDALTIDQLDQLDDLDEDRFGDSAPVATFGTEWPAYGSALVDLANETAAHDDEVRSTEAADGLASIEPFTDEDADREGAFVVDWGVPDPLATDTTPHAAETDHDRTATIEHGSGDDVLGAVLDVSDWSPLGDTPSLAPPTGRTEGPGADTIDIPGPTAGELHTGELHTGELHTGDLHLGDAKNNGGGGLNTARAWDFVAEHDDPVEPADDDVTLEAPASGPATASAVLVDEPTVDDATDDDATHDDATTGTAGASVFDEAETAFPWLADTNGHGPGDLATHGHLIVDPAVFDEPTPAPPEEDVRFVDDVDTTPLAARPRHGLLVDEPASDELTTDELTTDEPVASTTPDDDTPDDDEPAPISWRPDPQPVPAEAIHDTTIADTTIADTTIADTTIAGEHFVDAGADWVLGNSVPLVEVRGHGGLVMRRAEERWALADVRAHGDHVIEVDVDLRSGPGFGILFAADVDGAARMSGLSFDVDPVSEGGSFLIRQWQADRELWNPLARASMDDPSSLVGLLTIRIERTGDAVVAAVNGTVVLTVDDLHEAAAVHGRQVPVGDRVGVQAWSSSDLEIAALRVATR